MTPHRSIDATVPSPSSAIQRCVAIRLVDDGIMIYDTENHQAWIRSDAAVRIEENE